MCLDPISRRRFLQFTAAGVAGSASVAEAQTPAPARPQDQMTAGMIDFHVHTYPDNFDRTVGAVEAAQGARERGLKAIVLKGGAFETVTRAAQASAAVPGIKVYGGVVMNWPTGGINPAAVEAMAVFRGGGADKLGKRSEEHTSELQSPCNLVCRLLLEKKKKSKRHESPSASNSYTLT